MSLRIRLFTAFVVITAVLLGAAGYGINRLATLRAIAFEQRDRHAAAFQAVGGVQAALATFDRYARSFVVAPDTAFRNGMHRALDEAARELRRLIETGHVAASTGPEDDLRRLTTDARRIEEFVESDRLSEATAYFEAVKLRLRAADEALERIAVAVDQRSLADLEQAQSISETATRSAILVTVLALVLAVLVTLWSTYSLTVPLRRLRRAMAAVADGRLKAAADLPYDRRDEIGDLARSYRAMTQRLDELHRLQAEMVSMATHDLRTPVSVISGYAQLVEEGILGPLTDRQREAVVCIQEQASTLIRLTDQLLDIGRLEAGGLHVEPTEIRTRDFFDSIERGFEALAATTEVDFAVDVDFTAPHTFRADADRLRDQVLGNLLANAFKFTPRGGQIRVRVDGGGDGLRIEVADTGPGIPDDLLPRIFDKFSQAGNTRSRGTGLGLAIAKEIVDAHAGRITASSDQGRGTTFRITIPREPGPTALEPSPDPIPETAARPGADSPEPRAVHR